MNKFQKVGIILFVATIAALVYLEAAKPTPLNWFPSYSKTDPIPYGTRVLYELLQDTFKERLTHTEKPPYEQLNDTSLQGNYLFINNRADFDEAETKKMLSWVEEGNQVFIASGKISSTLEDTLGLTTRVSYLLHSLESKPMLRLIDPKLQTNQTFLHDKNVQLVYFNKIDTLSTTVLGEAQIYNDTLKITQPLPHFVKVNFGKGSIFIHCMEEAFSNYFILQDNHVVYTQNALSYINNGETIIWDDYYKTGKAYSLSPLRVILTHKSLRWAYYFLLFGIVLFVLFEGKRKQRALPVVVPLSNKTYEYTQTITGMYFDAKDNREIARKQIALLLDFIRTRLRMQTDNPGPQLYRSLAIVSGVEEKTVKELFNKFQEVHQSHKLSEETLKELYYQIQKFKNQIDGKSNN